MTDLNNLAAVSARLDALQQQERERQAAIQARDAEIKALAERQRTLLRAEQERQLEPPLVRNDDLIAAVNDRVADLETMMLGVLMGLNNIGDIQRAWEALQASHAAQQQFIAVALAQAEPLLSQWAAADVQAEIAQSPTVPDYIQRETVAKRIKMASRAYEGRFRNSRTPRNCLGDIIARALNEQDRRWLIAFAFGLTGIHFNPPKDFDGQAATEHQIHRRYHGADMGPGPVPAGME